MNNRQTGKDNAGSAEMFGKVRGTVFKERIAGRK
jgi:hypothetical protein